MDDYETSVYIPEEIISEIMQRLDVKALFRNKCVSKAWNSIISDPKFAVSYMNRTKSSSCSSNDFLWGYLPRSKASSTSIKDQAPSLYLPENYDDVLASSNGLVLCGNYKDYDYRDDVSVRLRLCICNPLTKQSISLPLIPKFAWPPDNICLATRLVSYKVVLIRNTTSPGDPNCAITIYSSDTGIWSDHEVMVKNCPVTVSNSWSSSNGVLHWFDFKAKTRVSYDPYGSPDRFGCIPLPIEGKATGVSLIQLGEEDAVKFGEIVDRGGGDRRLEVWRFYGKFGWATEQMCVISPEWNRTSNVLDYFCYLGVKDEACVSNNDLISELSPCSLEGNVPFALCPWACVGKDQDGSQTTSFRRVSNVWVSPRNVYTGVHDWASTLKYVPQ